MVCTTKDTELLFETMSRGHQACFEAFIEVGRDMSTPRQKVLEKHTERIQRARAQIDALLAYREE